MTFDELKMSSVSIPAISAGIFGGKKKDCVEIICQALKDFQPRSSPEKMLVRK
jgi:O-acetyl-ADP-ribose deacetylase (regulator of RNase III)